MNVNKGCGNTTTTFVSIDTPLRHTVRRQNVRIWFTCSKFELNICFKLFMPMKLRNE